MSMAPLPDGYPKDSPPMSSSAPSGPPPSLPPSIPAPSIAQAPAAKPAQAFDVPKYVFFLQALPDMDFSLRFLVLVRGILQRLMLSLRGGSSPIWSADDSGRYMAVGDDV